MIAYSGVAGSGILPRPVIRVPVVAGCEHGRVFTYALFDYDPERDGDEEEWARALADQGWRTWAAGSGPWIDLAGRRLRRWSLRRETSPDARLPSSDGSEAWTLDGCHGSATPATQPAPRRPPPSEWG